MRFTLVLTLATLLATTTGCELLESIEGDRSATVQVHVTHHATPEGGVFPNRGDDGEFRVFDNDEGWTITLQEAFVVTASATLLACDGTEVPLDLYWGALPENITDSDLDLFSFGGTEVEAGDYCSIRVAYGPYTPIDERSAQQYEMPEDADALLGATAYVRGFATKGEEMAVFELRADEDIVVEVELQGEGGGPLHVSGEEPFPVELTLSKTYDRFFDAVDFAALTEADLQANMMAVLGAETRVTSGTRVVPQ